MKRKLQLIVGGTQKDRILNLLRDGLSHDTEEIMNRCYRIKKEKGNSRIASRIYELRQEGFNIPWAVQVNGGLWKYRMIIK